MENVLTLLGFRYPFGLFHPFVGSFEVFVVAFINVYEGYDKNFKNDKNDEIAQMDNGNQAR